MNTDTIHHRICIINDSNARPIDLITLLNNQSSLEIVERDSSVLPTLLESKLHTA